MAVGTLPRRNGVTARKRESRAAVIEGCIEPGGRVVALFTGLREVRGDVIRICRSLKVLQMTTDAGCGRQVVVIVNVAIGALARRNSVHACKGEGCRIVVE